MRNKIITNFNDNDLPEIVRLLALLGKIVDELRGDPKYQHIVQWIEDWHDGGRHCLDGHTKVSE